MQKKEVIVIGAGFSGLLIGFYLLEKGFHVRFFEKKESVGGLLGSESTEEGVVERAANAFIANHEIERISSIIGVSLFEKKAQARKRYIFSQGHWRRWPLSFKNSCSLLGFLLRFLFYRKSVKPKEEQTLQEWGEKHLGKEVTDKVLSTAMQGVYATSADQLSASLVLGPLFSQRKKAQGLLKGSVSPRGGMGEWIEAMRDYLQEQGCQFHLGETWDGEKASCPVVLSTNLKAAKKILQQQGDSRFHLLKDVECLSLTSVTLHLNKESDALPEGFGCLFPKEENFQSLGVLNNSFIFEGRSQEKLSETWIFNDSLERRSQESKSELVDAILTDRTRMGLGNTEIINSYCFQWPQAIPHYGLELERALLDLEWAENNIFLMGNYLGQLGLSRLPNIAKKVVQQIYEKGVWQK